MKKGISYKEPDKLQQGKFKIVNCCKKLVSFIWAADDFLIKTPNFQNEAKTFAVMNLLIKK